VKRRGIQDDIVGGVRKIVSPWLGAPPGELKSVTRAKGAARGAAETLDQTVTGGLIKAGVQGNTALAKQAAINLAGFAVGATAAQVIGKVVSKAAPTIAKVAAKTNLSSELAPGQDLAFHFSNKPNLRVIKDISKMRNQGANFGQQFDSTKFTPKGSTYGYGPLQKTAGIQQVEAAINEALTSKAAAAAAGQDRQYTLYVTKANPLKNAKGRIKDPEYGYEVLAGDAGQSVYGKQKPIAKIPLNLDSVPDYGEVYRSGGPDALAERLAAVRAERNRVQNIVAENQKIRRAGLKSPGLRNVHGEGKTGLYELGFVPKPFNNKSIKSVTQVIREADVAAKVGKVAATAGFVTPKKTRGGGKNKR